MSELSIQENQADTREDIQTTEDTFPTESFAEENVKQKAKLTKKNILILGVALVAVTAALFALFHKSKFEKTMDGVLDIVGMVYGSGDYFTIDTYPDEYKNMDEAVRAIMLPDVQENALKAIKFANEELGFNGSVYSKMMETTALMGIQTEENSKYKVSWKYHPDDGLEVTYEEKH